MSAFLPIITTLKCGSCLELVKDGANGYLVPAEDPDMLANRIEVILSDLKLQSEMSKSSLAIIHSYTIENMANVHERILFGV